MSPEDEHDCSSDQRVFNQTSVQESREVSKEPAIVFIEKSQFPIITYSSEATVLFTSGSSSAVLFVDASVVVMM